MARMRGNEALQYAPRENDRRDEKNEYQADPRERAEHTAAEFFRDLETRDQNLANEIRSISGLTRMEDKDAAVFRPEWKDRDTPVSDWERTAHFRNGHEPSWMREGDRDSARGIAESFRKATGNLDFDEARTASHNLTETLMAPVSEQARILQDAPGFVREGPGGALQRDPGLDAMMKPFQEDLEQRTAWIQGTIERGLVNRNDGQVQYGMEQARILQEDFKNIGQGGGELNLLDPSLRAEYETRCEDRGRAMMENFHQFRERETEGVHEHGRPSAREMLAEIDRTEWERNSGSSPEGCLGNDLKKFGERNLPGDMKFMEEFMDREAASAGSQDRMNTTGWGGDQEMTIWDLRAGDGAERRETEHRGAAAEPEPSLTYREPLGQRAEQAGEAVNGAAHRDRAEERREERRDEHREGYSDDERPETRTLWDLRAERQEREALEPQERDPQEGWNQAQAQARDTVHENLEHKQEYKPEADEAVRQMMAEISQAEGLINQEVHDPVRRRVPLKMLDDTQKFLEEAGSEEEKNAAAGMSDRIVDDIYRFYIPQDRREPESWEPAQAQDGSGAAEDTEHGQGYKQETDESIRQLMAGISRTEGLINKEVTDSVNRRCPLQLLDDSQKFLEEADSEAERNAAADISNRIVDDIYRFYLPRQQRTL